jgi:hypothetical protein
MIEINSTTLDIYAIDSITFKSSKVVLFIGVESTSKEIIAFALDVGGDK